MDQNFAQPNFIVPTPPAGDSSNQAADTAFVQQAITSFVSTGVVSTAYITANTVANISTNFALTQVNSTGAVVLSSALTATSNALGANVGLTTTVYRDGPSVAQGSTGTWFAAGSVSCSDASAFGVFLVVLWDGTTPIASGILTSPANSTGTISLSGFLANPAGNLRMSVKSGTGITNGTMLFNSSGNSKDSVISVVRIA